MDVNLIFLTLIIDGLFAIFHYGDASSTSIKLATGTSSYTNMNIGNVFEIFYYGETDNSVTYTYTLENSYFTNLEMIR